MKRAWIVLTSAVLILQGLVGAQSVALQSTNLKDSYDKAEHEIPMRDGARLFTAVYTPKDRSKKYPILMIRTPYGVAPYGTENFPSMLGPSKGFAEDGYIFVYQDVRGRMMSDGEFKWMTPYKPKKSGEKDTDETTDTWDTIEWLLANVPGHNGRVGMWGISFPGHYAAQALIEPHPALKAVSPQAPMADNYLGDDMHHNGVFWLPHAFNFISVFGQPREGRTKVFPPRFEHGTPDGYRFFLEMGSLAEANRKYLKGRVAIWNEWMEHGDYDEYWRAQNVPQHLKRVTPAVMTVGGWFDAEDLYGALKIYEAIERHNPSAYNILVMGPWGHGDWGRRNGDRLGDIDFGAQTSKRFQEQMQLPFFRHFLKGEGELKLPEAQVFNTGVNKWREFGSWPPPVERKRLYLRAEGGLGFEAPERLGADPYDEYISDPSKPVPFINGIYIGMQREYMTADQRFAASRPDVLVYETAPLKEDITLAGPIRANLYVSTTGTDSDFVVKLIDVFPNDTPDYPGASVRMGGYQMLVRGDIMRAKYRNSFSQPAPMRPGRVTRISFEIPDVLHTFQRGHKIMVQIQSSWFPLADRNPQIFTNIYKAKTSDFRKATQRIYRAGKYSSHLEVGVF